MDSMVGHDLAPFNIVQNFSNFSGALAYGDVNMDGYGDLIIGVPDKSNSAVFVVYYDNAHGYDIGSISSIGQLNNSLNFGGAVAVLGDTNQDGNVTLLSSGSFDGSGGGVGSGYSYKSVAEFYLGNLDCPTYDPTSAPQAGPSPMPTHVPTMLPLPLPSPAPTFTMVPTQCGDRSPSLCQALSCSDDLPTLCLTEFCRTCTYAYACGE
jgi:hypothetical protein